MIIPADLNGSKSTMQDLNDKGRSYYFSLIPGALSAIFVEIPIWWYSWRQIPLFSWLYKG